MGYSVNFSVLGKSFVMPGAVSEKIKMFSDAQLKTAVWIFSHMGESMEPAVIAKKIGKPESAVNEALMYLASLDILVPDGETAVPEYARFILHVMIGEIFHRIFQRMHF